MFGEDDEDTLTPNYYGTTIEDTGPAIDKVLDHRPKEGVGKLKLSSRRR